MAPLAAVAAWSLAPHRRVVVLERARPPREKPCGGAATPKAVAPLRPAVDLGPPLAAGHARRVWRVAPTPPSNPAALRAPRCFRAAYRALAAWADPCRGWLVRGVLLRQGWPHLVERVPVGLGSGLTDAPG